MKEPKEPRVKEFLFLLYPESTDINEFIKRCRKSYLTLVISPLHDKDVFEETGELKKPHYHCAIIFTGLKTKQQCWQVAGELGLNHIEFIISTRRAALRYFCHLDDDDKQPYPVDDVRVIGEFSYSSVLNFEERTDGTLNFLHWLRGNDFTSFRDLVNKVIDERPQFLPSVMDKAYFYNLYARNEPFYQGKEE